MIELSGALTAVYDVLEKGSYAGARAAHMKVLYPDLVYGAVASSGGFVYIIIVHHSLMLVQ